MTNNHTVTLPVAFLARLFSECERIYPRTQKDKTPYWFGEDYDAGCYTVPSGPATAEEIEAQATLDAALDAYYESFDNGSQGQ